MKYLKKQHFCWIRKLATGFIQPIQMTNYSLIKKLYHEEEEMYFEVIRSFFLMLQKYYKIVSIRTL